MAEKSSYKYKKLNEVEAKLQENEKRFKTLLNATTEIAFLVKSDGTFLVVNNALAKSIGKPKKELIGVSMFELFSREDAGRRKPILQKIIDSKKPLQWKEDHAGKYFDNSAYPILDNDGNVDQIAIFANDITEQKKLTTALAEKTMYLDSILKSATGFAIATTDMDLRITYYNPLAEQFFGYTKEEVIGKTIQEVYTKEHVDQKRLEDAIEIVRTHGEYCYRLEQKKNNETRYLDLRVSGICSPAGGLIGFTLLSHDVTMRVKEKARLHNSQEHYRRLFDLLPYGAELVDLKGNIIDCNPNTASMLGYEQDELIGRHITSIFDAESIPVFSQKLPSIVKGNIEQADIRMAHKDGTAIDVIRTGQPIYDTEGKINHILTVNVDITQRKQAEENLRSIFENMQDVYYKLDADGKILAASPSAVKLYQYDSLDEIIGKHAKDFFYNINEYEKFLEKLQKNGYVKNYIIKHKRKDGKPIYVETNTNLLFDNQGNFEGEVGLLHDITDRIRADEELKKLSAAIRQSPVSIVITDLNGSIEYVNPKFCKLTGYSAEEAMGKNPSILKSGETSEESYKQLWKTILSGKEWRGEFLNKKKNNEYYWENAVISPIFNEHGDSTHILAVKEDITERKRIEIALKKSEKKFRILFNSITDLIYAQDIEGHFTSVNPAMQKLYGYNKDEFLGRKASDFMEPKLQSGYNTRYLDVVKKQGYQNGTSSYFKKNGEKIYIEYRSFLVEPGDSEPYISGIGRDVTEKFLSEKKVKKLQEQVAHSQKMETIGTLAGGIAHDFNNILFPVLGYTEMLLHDIPEDSPAHSSLKKIYAGANRAKELVKQILTFSRREKNDLKPMKIQPIIKEALKLIRSIIPTTIEIEQDIDPACGLIKADPTQIHQIIMNLTTNAYHAMGEAGGKLEVTVKDIKIDESGIIEPDMSSGDYVCLSVVDTGAGIDKELKAKIFDPFFTTKEIGRGTGMGLSVVHGIVSSMGGAIQVSSKLGKGTEFNVYFPAEKSSFGEQNIQSNDPHQGGIERILLVDDEKEIIIVEKLMLERMGYQITSHTSSIEALEVFKANPHKFDMIITDMAMPNMSGDKLCAELIKIRPDIPVLLCTGFSKTMSEKKAASLGIAGFLLKPIVMGDLSHKIREVLNKNKA